MDGARILKLSVFMMFLALNVKMDDCQELSIPSFTPRPLCISEVLLVNHACSLLPFDPSTAPNPPVPLSLPPGPDGDTDNMERHRRQRGHRRHVGKPESPLERDCCRWLTAMDSECVCDLLAHLPPFLSRPQHQYSVMVDESCVVTFSCGPSIKT